VILIVKVFRINSQNYNDLFLNDWSNKYHFKIDNVNVCPCCLYSDGKDIKEMDLIVTVIYHKKYRKRKDK